jgi:PAT family beta-lactamase induction signal transducer AmpG
LLPKNVLETKGGRLAAFTLLYLSEGIPFGFSAIALTAYLRQQGLGLTEIGLFTSSLYAPWGLKWAWAPLIDLIQIQRFGPRRMWIVGGQVMMIATLALLMWLDPGANLKLLVLLIAVHNVFAATQDIAIDALAVTVLPEKERGIANGFMFGGSYLGQTIGGSGALWIASQFGFQASFPFVCGMLALILIFVTLRLREPVLVAADAAADAVRSAGEVLRLFRQRLLKFLGDLRDSLFYSGRGPFLGVFFAAMPGGALALGLALSTTMQVDLGMDEGQIAELNFYTTVVAALGCVIGGWVSDRLGHRKMLALWYGLTTLPTFWLSGQFTGAAGMEGVTIAEYFRVAILYNFTSGLLQGTSIAVFMGLTSPLVAGTQFTGYMALKNLVYSYSSIWQGQMADAAGYAATLRLDAIIAFGPMLVLPFLIPSTRSRKE